MSEAEHNPCATCTVNCCSSYIVPLYGYDVWLISTGQRLSPEQFAVLQPEAEQGAIHFLLSAEEHPYSLALDKQGRFQPKQPCVFLLRLADGGLRCGIYNHRPGTCRAYPMSMWNGVVFQRKQTLCPPNAWPPSQVVKPHWSASVHRFHMHHDIYCEVVARWNARVVARPGTRFTLQEYFSFVMNVYDRLAALDAQIGEEGLAAIQASWPALPRNGMEADEIEVQAGEMPWLEYLVRARDVIDSFYPQVPPQPVLAFAPMHLTDEDKQRAGVPE